MTKQVKKAIYLEDRSGAELDDKCGMAYYWNRFHDKIGIVPAYEALELRVGREIHDDLDFVAQAKDPEEAAEAGVALIIGGLSEASTLADRERTFRRAGWLAAFALFIEPKIRANYENVQTEAELILDRNSLWIPTTPDRVLRNRTSRGLVYREYKSTISASSKWLNSWKYAPQLHIGMAAIHEELGEKVHYAQLMGLMKGDERDGRLHHPYVWAYRNGDEWTHEYAKARAAGWQAAPVWEFPGGLVEWVRKCGQDVALAQFPHTDPIFFNEKILNTWVQRRSRRRKIAELMAPLAQADLKIREEYFEPITSQCQPAFGFPCPYRMACWNASVNQDPLVGGEYVPRVPHHEVEVQWRKKGS